MVEKKIKLYCSKGIWDGGGGGLIGDGGENDGSRSIGTQTVIIRIVCRRPKFVSLATPPVPTWWRGHNQYYEDKYIGYPRDRNSRSPCV